MAESAENNTWAMTVMKDQMMFQHMVPEAELDMVLAAPASELLPPDLRKVLSSERQAISRAVFSWMSHGSRWPRTTPSVRPQGAGASKIALKRYESAKEKQSKLDLLTAAWLAVGSVVDKAHER